MTQQSESVTTEPVAWRWRIRDVHGNVSAWSIMSDGTKPYISADVLHDCEPLYSARSEGGCNGWIAARYTDGPNADGYYSAGIDIPRADRFGRSDVHAHAIEFHSKDKATAELRRDTVLLALRTPSQPAASGGIEQFSDAALRHECERRGLI